MASLSPFTSTVTSTSANFMGTLVSNLLLPSSRERQTCQSNSSGPRRLNRGNCCTPKFALAFFHKQSQLQAFPDFFSNWLKNRSNRLFSSVRTPLGFYWFSGLWNASSSWFRVLVDFWLNFDQANASLAFNQELGFLGTFSEGFEFYSALQDIPRFGLNSHCLT